MPINYKKTYDLLSHEEGIEFRDLTIELVKELYPHYSVKPEEIQNPDIIVITNQDDNVRIKLGLRDLYTRFIETARTRTDLKDTILSDYAHAFSKIEDAEYFQNPKEYTWADARDFVQPRLMKIEKFHDDLESFVYFPFGEGLVNAMIICEPDDLMNTRIRKEWLEKWNKTAEEVYIKALENFADVNEGLELVGTGKPHDYLWNQKGRDFSATAILLGSLRYLIAQTIGSPYRFSVPSNFVFFCWAELDDDEFQIEMKALIEREHDRLPGRLSTNIYEVDDKGQIKQIKETKDKPEPPKPQNFSNN